jgi:hypothetical protein
VQFCTSTANYSQRRPDSGLQADAADIAVATETDLASQQLASGYARTPSRRGTDSQRLTVFLRRRDQIEEHRRVHKSAAKIHRIKAETLG